MKNIIHYKQGAYLSLTETWIYEQIRNLNRYNPIVYCEETKNLDIFPVKVIRCFGFSDSGKIELARYIAKIYKVILLLYFLLIDAPKLVHAHYGHNGYSWLKFRRINTAPLITTFYGFDVCKLPKDDPIWFKRYQKLFEVGDCFLVEGTHMKKCLVNLGCKPEKVVVQHLGIDLSRIKFAPRYLKEGEDIKILISGSFKEKKGFPYAIEAFAKLRQQLPDFNFKLTIIGDSNGSVEFEEEKRKILEVIDLYKLRKHIVSLGYQPYPVFIKELYNNHIFLSPSVTATNGDTEGGAPVSIIEASASGMPIVATTHCDIPEVVINNKGGYLVAEKDVEAMVEKLRFLVTNPQTWERMGQLGRMHIEQQYNVKTQAERLEKIYDRVILSGCHGK